MAMDIYKKIRDLSDPMRVFPILNKFDRIWSHRVDKPFCEVYKDITQGKDLTDEEFTKAMEEYIDKNGIK